jgi:(p)ppGpp synthase/HD superfamily hydrolase
VPLIENKNGYLRLENGLLIRSNLPLDEVGFMDYEVDFKDAKKIAEKMHEKQKYGKHPYSYHLNAVAQALKRFGYDPEGKGSDEHIMLSWDLVTAAWLHDIVEDTPLSQTEISRRFNSRVSGLVHAVTNPSGGNRAWRASQVYPKIKYTPNALTLKLADRIANLEESRKTGSRLINMYRKEWKSFEEKYKSFVIREDFPMWYRVEELIGDFE